MISRFAVIAAATLASSLPGESRIERLSIPSLTCRVTTATVLRLPNLTAVPSSDSTIYRFANNRLYLAPTDRSEYEYGKVVEVEPGRFTVGHKVIVFDGDGSKYVSATVTHTHQFDLRVVRLRCG